MRKLFIDYKNLEKAILFVILTELFIQLINAVFMQIQPLYMRSVGMDDGSTADYISYRFLGTLLFALPLGIYIKGKKLKPFFYVAAILIPLTAIINVYAIWNKWHWMIYFSQFMWGAAFCFVQVPVIPFILRNAKKETHTSAISLNYSTWSIGGILSLCTVGTLNFIDPIFFDEKMLLLIISLIGFIGIYFLNKVKIDEKIPQIKNEESKKPYYDWSLILRALIPTIIIAVGAGLTIPFISLFFSSVHGLSTGEFSFLSAAAMFLVAAAALMVPKIKSAFGYQFAVPTTQSFAVLALVLLATTEYYNDLNIAVYIAMGCFLIRQPLMNMAGPMTTEITMNYVGSKNREIVSALTSSIWSGSWFISSRIFKMFRESGYEYVNIFLITAALYIFGVIWYYLLILDYKKREQLGLMED